MEREQGKCEQYTVVCRQLPRFARNSLSLEGAVGLGGESTFENSPDLIINFIYYFTKQLLTKPFFLFQKYTEYPRQFYILLNTN